MSPATQQSVMRKLPMDQMDEIEQESGAGALAKSLGLWQLTAIGVGGIIGVGIFTLAGLVANGGPDGEPVGPAVLISFLIAQAQTQPIPPVSDYALCLTLGACGTERLEKQLDTTNRNVSSTSAAWSK